MLLENPRSRPTIYQVLREACSMQGRDVPIKDVSLVYILVRMIRLNDISADILCPRTVRIIRARTAAGPRSKGTHHTRPRNGRCILTPSHTARPGDTGHRTHEAGQTNLHESTVGTSQPSQPLPNEGY